MGKIARGSIFPKLPDKAMLFLVNRMADYIAVQNSRDCRADFKLVGNLGLIGPAVTGILHCNVINHAINQK